LRSSGVERPGPASETRFRLCQCCVDETSQGFDELATGRHVTALCRSLDVRKTLLKSDEAGS